MRGSRSPARVERLARLLTALAIGPIGAARGCGTGSITACLCPAEADVLERDAEATSLTCTSVELDAGCQTLVRGLPSGPLPPPELAV